jgi:hypothetical protein
MIPSVKIIFYQENNHNHRHNGTRDNNGWELVNKNVNDDDKRKWNDDANMT